MNKSQEEVKSKVFWVVIKKTSKNVGEKKSKKTKKDKNKNKNENLCREKEKLEKNE